MSVTTNTKNYWFEQAMQNMEARAMRLEKQREAVNELPLFALTT